MENLNHQADTDEYLCWAAATSNVLHYTGWGQQAGFGSTDYLLDLFTTSFNDDAGNTFSAVMWFFSGYNPSQNEDSGACVDDGSYGVFLGCLPQYPAETILRNH